MRRGRIVGDDVKWVDEEVSGRILMNALHPPSIFGVELVAEVVVVYSSEGAR